jgi:short-subunit dehydrogenase
LRGSSAIITGASRGLGRLFAVELASMGAGVTIVARSGADLAETAALVEQHGVECLPIVGDVTDDKVATAAVERTMDRFGTVDVLVNNAGIAHLGAFADHDVATWWRVITVNLRAPAVWMHAVLPEMRRRRRGRIINVSSTAGADSPLPYISSYSASKAALSQFTAALAPEVAADGVAVLALGPLAVTHMTRDLWETDALPPSMRDDFHDLFVPNAALFERLSVDLFRFVAVGGADHLSGSYVGAAGGVFDTPADLTARPPTPASVHRAPDT